MLSASAPHADTGWIATPGGFSGAAWFEPVAARRGGAAVLIVPGIAHEERTMADGLAALARSLAGAGLGTLLIDLHGTAHSSGQLDTPDIGALWRGDVQAALRHLRGAGFAQVIVVGVRLGALIAFDALRDEPLAGFVAWAPVVSGRRHVRELRVLQGGGADTAAPSIAGHCIPATVLADLAKLEFGAPAESASPMLLIDRPELLSARWAEAFATTGPRLDRQAACDLDRWLFSPDLLPTLPRADIHRITAWCEQQAAPRTELAAPRLHLLREIVLTDATGRCVRERTVRIEPQGLAGIVSEPADVPAQGAARLLATLVGPGRLFPEFARAEAARGKACLRFDFAGFSTSRRRADGSGASLYSPRNRVDVLAALAWLRAAGHRRIAMLGFCAGAWAMVHAGAAPGVVGLVGINVALYRQPDYAWRDHLSRAGHPLSKGLSLLRRAARLAPWVDRIERNVRVALNPGRWLLRLGASPVRLLLVYGAADLGLVHLARLTQRFGKRLRAPQREGRLGVRAYGGLGHLTDGAAARARALADIAAFLDELDQGAPALAAPPLSPLGQRRIARSC